MVNERERIVNSLFARTTRGVRLGLDRVRAASERMGAPHSRYPCIHVAGTNGKGSVCTYLESVLRRHGYRTGLFIKPHLVAFEERFLINGKPVVPEAWVSIYHDIARMVEEMDLTFFEVAVLLAFEIFWREQVDWAILETGLGGRLDATNIVTPRVSAITRIGVDHTEYLGTDILSIAGEKLGIVKPGVPVVMAPQDDDRVVELARRVCGDRGAPLTVVGSDETTGDRPGTVRYGDTDLTVGLPGRFQPANAACALRALGTIMPLDTEMVAQGLQEVRLPGRLDMRDVAGRQVLFDVDHNEQAARELAVHVRGGNARRPVCTVAGVMGDKDAGALLAQYASFSDCIVCTRPKTPRAMSAAELASHAPEGDVPEVRVMESVAEAVHWALETREGLVCVAGSFYTVGEAMSALGLAPYDDG